MPEQTTRYTTETHSPFCVDLAPRLVGGGTRYFPANYSFWNEAKTHLADTSCKGNPVLCDFHQVFLPYCSQDLWTGQATAVSAPGSPAPGYFFSGHLILSAVINDLAAKHGLGNATEIVLSGESAGGFGVYANVDWLASRYANPPPTRHRRTTPRRKHKPTVMR